MAAIKVVASGIFFQKKFRVAGFAGICTKTASGELITKQKVFNKSGDATELSFLGVLSDDF
jgi:hypothetical protein